MTKTNKISLYELNVKTFKDNTGNGTGDLKGLANKFDYFEFLGVDGIVLQDIITTDHKEGKLESFTQVNPQIGDVNELILVISKAKKHNKKLLMELNLGSISKNNKWFRNAIEEQTAEFKNMLHISNQKIESEEFKSEYNEEAKSYYLMDEKTQEVPLNWQSNTVIAGFVDVIKFWTNLGINGFVFKNFEYVGETNRQHKMSEATLKELRKFYLAIKEVDDRVMVIGKSNIVSHKETDEYTDGPMKVFDYFQATDISRLGLHEKYGTDVIGSFKPRQLYKALKTYAKNPANIVSFGSNTVGRFISRWGDEGQYNQESAKAFGMLQLLHPASSSIYYADELGAKNIQLTHLDNFQDADLENRKKWALEHKILEKEFMDAQVLQNPINARSLMLWNSDKNAGFSVAEKTITPVSAGYQEQNVEVQFADENSVLNFYKELNRVISSSSYAKVIREGEFKISSMVPGVIKYDYVLNNKEVVVYVNITDSIKPIKKIKAGKVAISSIAGKDYPENPSKLDAYEAILISKNTDEYIKETQQIKLKAQRAKIQEEREKAAAVAAKEAEKELEKLEKAKAKEKAKAEAEKEKTREIKLAEKEKTREMKLAEKEEKLAAKEAAKQEKLAEKTREMELREAEKEAEKEARELEKLEKAAQEAEEKLAKVEEKAREIEIKAATQETVVEQKEVEQNIKEAEESFSPIGQLKETLIEQKNAEHEAQIKNEDITSLKEEELAPTTQIDLDEIEDIEEFLNSTK